MTPNEKYNEKMKRLDDALAMKEPDRVPIIPVVETFCTAISGHTMAEVMYDAKIAQKSVKKYLEDYDPDCNYGYAAFFGGLGPALDKSGTKFLQWAGQKGSICTENSIHQFVEKPYLEDDEYPVMLSDLSGWLMRRFLPRYYDVFKPLANLDFSSMIGTASIAGLMQFADPAIGEMFTKLGEIGKMVAGIYQEIARFDQEMIDFGYPLMYNGLTTVAFDTLSDCLRGTIDTMADLYEQPEYVLQAIDHFYPGTLYGAIAQAEHSPGKMVFIPLHKGLDGFMGPEQYAKFYWPTLKKLVEDLIAHGLIPYVYTEGKYDSRLAFLKELPAGKCLVHFEDCDMKEAKRLVGDHCCISGGFDAQLLVKGTPESVTEAVKRTLDICAPGGGYMFDLNTTLTDDCKPENVAAMFDVVKTYGVY